MIGNFSLLSAVLTGVSVVSLSLLSLLCLRCKRKSKINEVEHQIYNPQTFHRGGSRFAVTQSKTVTRTNQMTSRTNETHNSQFPSASFNHQSSYENISTESPDHTYVDPIPGIGYENEQKKSGGAVTNEDPGIYANITSDNDDVDDYENAEFLEQVVAEQEDDEPDYVNENREFT